MIHPPQARNIFWFGKLPCVGDFCSHNMSAYMLSELDEWLSTAMQSGMISHGSEWTRAYFETPMHGFVWGSNTLPALGETLVVGVIMPSVDKAGRAFPFVLIEQLERGENPVMSRAALENWFSHAHALCADALNEEWPLEKLNEKLAGLPKIAVGPNLGLGLGYEHDRTLTVQRECTHWFRIDFAGEIKWVMQHHGLPRANAFGVLLGLTSPIAPKP